MKVQMFESKSPFKGQQIKLGLAAVLGSAAFLLGGCSQNLGINSGTDQAQAEEESAVVDYTCISNPDSREKNYCLFYIWPSVWPLLWPRTSISAELPGSIIPNIWN